MPHFKRIGLTIKSELSGKDTLVEHVLSILTKEGMTVYVDPARMKELKCVRGYRILTKRTPIDLLVVIGGDGTIFRAIRERGMSDVPILGINRGAIGFLSEIDMDEIDSLLPKLLRGHGTIEHRHPLVIVVQRKGKTVFQGFALNEAVIAQGAIARLLYLQTSVRSESLTTYRADGLIIATPTGSTAYSLSAGGPIVHPRLPALILTPINPHSFTQKPIVLPGTDTVDVEVQQKENKFIDSEVSLTLDGQVYHRLRRFDRVTARIHPEAVKFLRRKEDTFFARLRSKLKWGETIDS